MIPGIRLRAPLKIRFFIIKTMKKSNFYIESAQGNHPNLIFRGSLITTIALDKSIAF